MRHDSCMNPGRLRLEPKSPYEWGDDHTSTMVMKQAHMNAGIVLDRPINYQPQHRRSARGIVAGIVLGTALWIVIGLFAAWAWRMYGL
ncbi:MAG: hypothetical protein IPO75_15980 [Betaproteobacteria bacterium]|nr:hypothetical protein [Betaproteobacteria bacterium]